MAPPAGFKRHGGREGRPSAGRRGYGARWQRYRKLFLSQFRWCRRCEEGGQATAATVVDHIVRVAGADDELFWVRTNHQPLCATCHGVKTRAEDRGERFDAARPYPGTRG